MFSLRPVLNASLALLVFLMTNYNALREEGQGFYLEDMSRFNEKQDSITASAVGLFWWCDLEFSSDDATNNFGYVGRAVLYLLGSSLGDFLAQGAPSIFPSKKKQAFSVSAVMVPSLGIFAGQFHNTQDDWVNWYWDDGSSTLPILFWEGHDEGDTSPKPDTSAWSGSGTLTKIMTKAAAELLGMDVADMTPATCSMEYKEAWNATHVQDPIDISMTTLEDNVAQLQADNKELLSCIAAIEGSLNANGSGSSGKDGEATATTSLSPFIAAIEYAT